MNLEANALRLGRLLNDRNVLRRARAEALCPFAVKGDEPCWKWGHEGRDGQVHTVRPLCPNCIENGKRRDQERQPSFPTGAMLRSFQMAAKVQR